MRREDFEVWLDDHKDEAVDRIEANEMPLKDWIKVFSKALKLLNEEEGGGDSGEEDVDGYDF